MGNLSSYESGARTPSSETLAKIRRGLAPQPPEFLRAHRTAVLDAARRRGGTSVRVFGSVARGEDLLGSDIDLLVDFRRGTTLLDVAALSDEPSALLGIRVDVISRGGCAEARVNGYSANRGR